MTSHDKMRRCRLIGKPRGGFYRAMFRQNIEKKIATVISAMELAICKHMTCAAAVKPSA